jgi:hypothetical protein
LTSTRAYRHKSRKFTTFLPTSLEGSSDGGKTWKKAAKQPFELGTQYTESEGHGKSKDGRYHEGGPFYTARASRNFPTVLVSKGPLGSKPNERFQAHLGTPLNDSWLSPTDLNRLKDAKQQRSTDLSDLDALGATAINLCNPMNPNAELGVAFGEVVRDGIPSIPGIQTWKRRTKALQSVGSEFLNVAFGWLPLVNDVKDTSQSIRDGRTILQHYQAGRGSNTHREFAFPTEVSEQVLGKFSGFATAVPGGGTSFPPYFQSLFGPADITLTQRVESKRWFSGSFTYDVPSQSDSWGNALRIGSEADKLFGIALSPDVLWELTPWSWAIDWFSNAGDVISNISAFELAGLVMRYGYVMEERTQTITSTFTPGAGQPPDLGGLPPQTIEYSYKVRRPANPYGFGVTFEGLSPLQTAITTALGLSRLR